jgi:hypothetical protein
VKNEPRHPSDKYMDFYSKDPKSLAHDLRGTLKVVLLLSVGMSIFAYVALSNNPRVLAAAFLAFIVLEIVQLLSWSRRGEILHVACEVAYFLVLTTAVVGLYHKTMAKDFIFLQATIFYRPYYTFRRNRRLALVLGVLILIVALPITLGIVTDRESVRVLSVLYLLLVASLWAFCSKLGARFFGFDEGDAADDSNA